MNMKKCILFVFFLIPLMSDAQNFIKSYSAYRCWSPNTGTQNAANIATAVYFYDDHIRTFTGNFIYSGRNAEDALIYVPELQGSSILSTQMIIISSDFSQMREVQQSSFGGMTIQIIYDFQYIGDGDEPAKKMATTNYFLNKDYNDEPSSYTCKSCGGTGLCQYCNGTGNPTYSGESVCGICHGTGRCQGCHGKGKY